MSATAPKKRVKKPKLPASIVPHDCAILAVDPGETSGWSIWVDGVLEAYGECGLLSDTPRGAVAKLLSYRGPHIVVVERPFVPPGRTHSNVGTGDRVWRMHAEAAGLARRIVRVYPATWRSRVLGKGWGSAKREAVQAKEQQVALAMLQTDNEMAWRDALGAEEAPAILIGLWATHAGEVGAKLPRVRKKKVA